MMSKINVEELLSKYNLFILYEYNCDSDHERISNIFISPEKLIAYLQTVDKEIFMGNRYISYYVIGYNLEEDGRIKDSNVFDYYEMNSILLVIGRDDILKERLIIRD